jgi:hypothetical protein
MVGLFPDGKPYWAALYDESVLVPNRHLAKEKMRGFFAFDPGLAAAARIAKWHAESVEEVAEFSVPLPDDANVQPEVKAQRGRRWHQQQSSLEVEDVVDRIRSAAIEGRLVRSDFDHNSKEYDSSRGSNKQLTIAAKEILGRAPTSFDEAWRTVVGKAFGN